MVERSLLRFSLGAPKWGGKVSREGEVKACALRNSVAYACVRSQMCQDNWAFFLCTEHRGAALFAYIYVAPGCAICITYDDDEEREDGSLFFFLTEIL